MRIKFPDGYFTFHKEFSADINTMWAILTYGRCIFFGGDLQEWEMNHSEKITLYDIQEEDFK